LLTSTETISNLVEISNGKGTAPSIAVYIL